jgi:exodeoxyribonuclease V alpha subunit
LILRNAVAREHPKYADSGELDEVALAYAITIHKSQGSEFPAVVIPLATQHYMLLQRNLIYTGITRGKRLLVLIGQKKALGIAVRNDRPHRRYSGLLTSLKGKRDTDGSAVESKTPP